MSKPIPRITASDLEQGEDIDIVEEEEKWNTYKLSDGTTLKVKLVLREVKRLKKWRPDGNPIYMINTSNVVRTIDIPKQLKAKPKPSAFKPV